MRTGSDYLESLRDGRAVFVLGEKVADVPAHSAFTGVTRTVAALYDFAADPSTRMTYTSPEIGAPANKVFMTPRSRQDLADRRSAIAKWAHQTRGFLGRSPDHVGGFIAGFASAPQYFDRDGRNFGNNVVSFYKRLLEGSLFCLICDCPSAGQPSNHCAWMGR